MATAAEPHPAELPLPGGRDGAAVRVHPMLTATISVAPAYAHRAARLAALRALGLTTAAADRLRLPIPAFLIEHPNAGLVLVDTGFHPSVAVDERPFGRLGGLIFKDLEMTPEQAVPGQMRERGFDPDDVRTVVLTHLHADHASGISQFPNATFVLSEAEWSAAAAGGPRQGYFRHHFDHAFDYRLLDFDSPGADSFASFGRAFDLFGDGSLMLVYTPGHSAGHLSVVARLAGRELLLAGDAVFTMPDLEGAPLPFATLDGHLAGRSLYEIGLYRRETPSALIVPGHDMVRWEELDRVLA
jgi:glyoxylase-like metal-dependent hydrolase (beta-lactamase superfamily II)